MHLFGEHEQVVVCHEPEAGLRAIIAVHDTTLGPALGGIRMWTYASDEAALTDVLRLSRGMTYKNSMAGLPLGGGKTVVLGDPRTDKSDLMFRALGRFIDALGGRYIAAEDVGISIADAEVVARETRHMSGLPVATGGSGDPSPMTAWGVFCGMRSCLREADLDGFEGVRVAVQGAGHVGAALTGHLLEAGARVTVADIYSDRTDPLARAWRRDRPGGDDPRRRVRRLLALRAGGAINPNTVGELRCRIVAGAANNQLLDDAMGDELQRRGIVYAPDYVINAGGVINIGEELDGAYDAERARRSVERIEGNLDAVFERARADGVPPHRAANLIAEERIATARSARADAVESLYRPSPSG